MIKASAILHDVGIHEAERKYGSAAGKYQEIEGPPIAGEILKKSDIPSEAVEHICRIIANPQLYKESKESRFYHI